MKKIFFIGLLVTLFLFLLNTTAYADMPSRYDSLPHCSSIQNPTAFKDYYLIGYSRYVGAGDRSFFIINTSKCLSKGYKFNSFKLLIAKKDYINSLGIEKLNPFDGTTVMNERLVDSNVQIVDSPIDPGAVGVRSYSLKQKTNGSFYANEGISVIKNSLILMRNFLPEFLLTLLIEILILISFLRKFISIKKIVLWGFIINAITFPLAQYFILGSGTLFLVEIGVFLVEAILIKYLIQASWRKSFTASFVANFLTTVIGLFIIATGTSLLGIIKAIIEELK